MLHLLWPLGTVPSSAAPQPTTHEVIYLKQSLNWLPIAVGAAQSIAGLFLTWLIFEKNRELKKVERQAIWYQHVVADPCIELSSKFFRSTSEDLEAAVFRFQRAKVATANSEADLPPIILEAIGANSQYKKSMRATSRQVQDLVGVYKADAAQAIFNRFLRMDDEISDWFDTLQYSSPADHQESLYGIISSCQADVLRKLYDYESDLLGITSKI